MHHSPPLLRRPLFCPLPVPQLLCKMAADRAVPGVVEWLLICEAQVTGVRTRTLPIEVLVYLFTASGDVIAIEVFVLGCLEDL